MSGIFGVGPMAWNTLPDNLRDPVLPPHTFRAELKTAALILLAYQHIRGSATMRYIFKIDIDIDC